MAFNCQYQLEPAVKRGAQNGKLEPVSDVRGALTGTQ